MPDSEDVRLRIPTDAAYLPIVRVAGAVIGDRAGLTHADIEDLRLALDELVHHALTGSGGDLELGVSLGTDAVTVEGVRTGAGDVGGPLPPVIHDAVTAAVDELELDHDGPGSFRIVKRSSRGTPR